MFWTKTYVTDFVRIEDIFHYLITYKMNVKNHKFHVNAPLIKNKEDQ